MASPTDTALAPQRAQRVRSASSSVDTRFNAAVLEMGEIR